MITFTLVPKSGRHVTKKSSMEIRTRGKQRFISQNDACKAAELDLHRQAKHVALVTGALPFTGPLVLAATFVFPTKDATLWGTPKATRPDTGNLGALLADALEGAVYDDDAQIVDERIVKVWGERCEILVEIRQWGT